MTDPLGHLGRYPPQVSTYSVTIFQSDQLFSTILMARKIETERRTAGGLEDTLDFAAGALLIVGLICAGVTVVWMKFYGVLSAYVIIVSAVLSWFLLKASAEIIRLLKKLNGLPFGGKISQPNQSSVYICSECNAILHSETKCESCGATIERG